MYEEQDLRGSIPGDAGRERVFLREVPKQREAVGAWPCWKTLRPSMSINASAILITKARMKIGVRIVLGTDSARDSIRPSVTSHPALQPLSLGVPRALHLIYSTPLRYTLANNVDPLEPGLQRYEPWSYSYIVALQRTNTDRDRIQTTERLGHSILNKHAKGEVSSNTSQTECTDVETRERNLS